MLRFTMLTVARVAVVLLASLTLLGCGRLRPPRLTPQSVQVTRVSPSAMGVRVEVDAYNPNRISLSVQSVSATIKLAGRVSLGSTSVSTKTSLAAGETTRVVADLDIPWGNLMEAVALAQGKERIPYTLEGRARIGGQLSIEVPFTIRGEVTAEQLLRATLQGLPNIGFP